MRPGRLGDLQVLTHMCLGCDGRMAVGLCGRWDSSEVLKYGNAKWFQVFLPLLYSMAMDCVTSSLTYFGFESWYGMFLRACEWCVCWMLFRV